jgi:hypothetical protein
LVLEPGKSRSLVLASNKALLLHHEVAKGIRSEWRLNMTLSALSVECQDYVTNAKF